MAIAEANQLLFDEVEARVRRYNFHPFLVSSDIQLNTSRFHFDVASAILHSAKVQKEEATNVVVALLLLQEGLSVHDRVDNQTPLVRQLTVLAGDYNSSQFYSVLASVNNNAVLMHLSRAVVAINEAKVLLNSSSDVSPQQYMNYQVTVQGELLFALVRHYFGDSSQWLSTIESLVRAFVVKEEAVHRSAFKHFTLSQATAWITEGIERLRQAGSLLEPIASSVAGYLIPIKNRLETQAFAEGNR